MRRDINKIKNKKTVWEGKYLRSVIITYSDSSGKLREWESVERINCNGIVAIVAVTDNEEILLVRQYRPAINGYVIEVPAGLNDKGDTFEEASRRELLEETGYSARKMVFLAEGPLSSGASDEIIKAFLAIGIEFKGINKRDETEDIEVLKVPIKEFYQKMQELREKGDYIDLKVYGLLELAKEYL